ncbi:conserved hypothetical protein [Ricinus communis]|uniref:Uncharacterized protein n=1 Tax=Ricinus communis TaxID=3988 RepID=B9RRJ2_RICCO|nr:conserved hypothetical protein [Ricinus communis]
MEESLGIFYDRKARVVIELRRLHLNMDLSFLDLIIPDALETELAIGGDVDAPYDVENREVSMTLKIL